MELRGLISEWKTTEEVLMEEARNQNPATRAHLETLAFHTQLMREELQELIQEQLHEPILASIKN